jgi:hypothetical protein
MARIIAFAICFGLVLPSACATTRASVGATIYTTSANVNSRCLDEDATCMGHSECCSARCDNGVCVREEP